MHASEAHSLTSCPVPAAIVCFFLIKHLTDDVGKGSVEVARKVCEWAGDGSVRVKPARKRKHYSILAVLQVTAEKVPVYTNTVRTGDHNKSRTIRT